ncbi:MAG: MEDS domain-containing protein [Terriglobia bacterium]
MQKDQNPAIQFVIEGLQIGQQVVAMAGPGFLRELAHGLGECGMRPDVSLRNGRLIFLTAPGCISTLMKPDDPLQRGSLRTNAPLLRWVSDWTWAYGNAPESARAAEYQRRAHEFIRSLGALSLCTAFDAQMDRNSMLALLADHRRCSRTPEQALQPSALTLAAAAGRSS